MSMNFDTDVSVMSGHSLAKAGNEVPVANSIAIVANGDTHIAISSGEYVYVKNHGTLAEGLYKASANIAADGTLSTSNLTAESKGLANVISNLFQTKSYSYGYSVSASSYVTVSASNLKVSTPTGYTPVAITIIHTETNNVVPYRFDVTATGSDTMVGLRNTANSASGSKTLYITILYMRTGI